jgi:rhodanese-related sulfurtransferase
MAASSAAELAKRPGTVVVDTRPTAEFNRFHIDGAISLQADAIRTKSFLMKHPLVLVGSGKGEQELYSQCAQLRTNGNPATHVLQGGMAAWVLSELPMVGTAPAASEMVTLSPAELFAEVSGGSSRYFVLPGAAKIKDQIPAATVLGSGRLETGLVAIKNTPPAQAAGSRSIVVIGEGAVTQAQIASAAALLRPRPVLFYLDGASSYSKFVSAQKAVWVAHAHGPKVPPCSLR